MTEKTLVLRLSRRAIAAAMVTDEVLTFCDGRHLTSRKTAALTAARRYVTRVLDLSTPDAVVIDAPVKDGSTTTALLDTVAEVLKEHQLPSRLVATVDVLATYGLRPSLQTRGALRRIVEAFWPDLPSAIGKTRPYVLEAAATALYDQTVRALSPTPP
jgi:hypothetical protein